ncbi:MAG: FCD domain-containing protein, partial [Mesorhizobium sp.]
EAYRINHMKIRLIRQQQTSFLDGRIVPAMKEHLAVLDAVGKRDVERAVDALTRHIRIAEDRALGRAAPDTERVNLVS